MIEQSIQAPSDGPAPTHPTPSEAPLAHPPATAGEKDTRYAAGVSLAAVLGSTLLGVKGRKEFG